MFNLKGGNNGAKNQPSKLPNHHGKTFIEITFQLFRSLRNLCIAFAFLAPFAAATYAIRNRNESTLWCPTYLPTGPTDRPRVDPVRRRHTQVPCHVQVTIQARRRPSPREKLSFCRRGAVSAGLCRTAHSQLVRIRNYGKFIFRTNEIEIPFLKQTLHSSFAVCLILFFEEIENWSI